jgi:hypothetical protein
MPAVYALATDLHSESTHNLLFGLVTDGQKVEVVASQSGDGEEIDGEDIRSIRSAFYARLPLLENSNTLEESAGQMFYNFPVEVTVSEEFSTYEEAAEELRTVFSSHDDIPEDDVNFYTPEPDGDEDSEEE